MPASKKRFDEHLQELRNPKHNRIGYRKRIQQDKEAEKQLKEYEKKHERN